VYVIAAAPISYGLRVEASIAIARGALQQRVGSLGEGRRQDDCTEQLLGHRVITEAIGPANGRRSEFFFTIRRDRRILVLMCKADAGSHSR
jgi:hypothetical protein